MGINLNCHCDFACILCTDVMPITCIMCNNMVDNFSSVLNY